MNNLDGDDEDISHTHPSQEGELVAEDATPQQITIRFVRGSSLPERFSLKGNEEEAYVVSTAMNRKQLSELINQLLNLDTPQTFDFLIEDEFLRTSLAVYMHTHEITSESQLTITYVVLPSEPITDTLCHHPDWISSLSYPIGSGDIVLAAYMDGTLGVCDQKGLLNSSSEAPCSFYPHRVSSMAITSADSYLLFRKKSSTTIGVSMGFANAMVCLYGVKLFSPKEEDETAKDSSKIREKRKIKLSKLAVGRFHSDYVQSVAFSGDHKWVASSGWDNNIKICENVISMQKMQPSKVENESNLQKRRREEGEDLEPLMTLSGHRGCVNSLCFSSDASSSDESYLLFSGSSDMDIRLWDINREESLTTWSSGHIINSMASSPTTPLVATGHVDGRLKVWDIRKSNHDAVATLKEVETSTIPTVLTLRNGFSSHKKSVNEVSWNKWNDKLIASVSHDSTLKIYDIRSMGVPVHTIRLTHSDPESSTSLRLQALTWCDAHMLVSGGSDGVIRTHRLSDS